MNFFGWSPMQPQSDRLHKHANTSIWTSTSVDFVRASSGSKAPLWTICTRSSASVDKPRNAWTPRNCAWGSGDAANPINGPRQCASNISSWFAGFAHRFAIAKHAAFLI